MDIIRVLRMPLFQRGIESGYRHAVWAAVSHVDLDGQASKIDGRWLLTQAGAAAVPVPVP
jgi:hypothetical protein